MRLTTWNVNGIRNPFSYQPWNSARTFPAMFDILEADIIVMQELKIQRKDLRDDMVLLDGWDCYFSLPKQKKGYSGVGVYTRNATCAPIRAEEGLLGVLTPPNSTTEYRDLPESEHIGGYPTISQIAEIAESVQLSIDATLLDSEGRCVCLEFPAFVLFGVYSPANSNGQRDDFRLAFLSVLDCRIRNLIKMGKRVVLVGDLNVSRSEIDTASALEDLRKAGLTHEDYISTPNRRIFNQLIIGGEVVGQRDEGREEPVLMDVVREFHPQRKGMYTHWEQKINARPGNFGSRIDFVLASSAMQGWFSDGDIQEGLMGSDHCPVYGSFKDLVPIQEQDEPHQRHLLDIMNPPGFFRNGTRQRPWSVKDAPAFSAKLMPEFYQRRSIKDMFKKPTIPSYSPASAVAQAALPSHNDQQGSNENAETANDADHTGRVSSPTKSLPPESPDRKRKASDPPAAKATKKQKPAANVSKGQQSLKGFFQAKPTAQTADSAVSKPKTPVSRSNSFASTNAEPLPLSRNGREDVKDSPATAIATDCKTARAAQSEWASITTSTANSQSPAKPESPRPPARSSITVSSPDTDDTVHDPIVSKESWQTLFRKPAAPMCEEHNEPCKSMLTKKKGENQGRSFWMCARPLGPSGTKEKGSQWRCPTFIWCSDWKRD
ncbi:hypothetical protein MBLNU459_g4006t1 [Dothideomycetes sp. NU459]